MIEKFNGGPVGVAAMAALLGESADALEDVFEPYLLRIGFIDRTPQGRVVTEAARAHLGKSSASLWGKRLTDQSNSLRSLIQPRYQRAPVVRHSSGSPRRTKRLRPERASCA
jgi:hypothetical protein